MGVCQIEEQLQSSCKNVLKSCSTRYVPQLISTAAKNGVWHDTLSTEGETAWIRSNVIYVALLCLSPCLCMWSKSTQGRGKVTQPLPLAQPASALKLRQAVIINEETWANGQEMQRYWLGRLPCSKLYRLAPAWWPVVSQAAVCGGGGQPRCETRPPLAAVCHIQTTPEGQSTGVRTRKAERTEGTWLTKRILFSSREQQYVDVPTTSKCVINTLCLHEEGWCKQGSWAGAAHMQEIGKYLTWRKKDAFQFELYSKWQETYRDHPKWLYTYQLWFWALQVMWFWGWWCWFVGWTSILIQT